MDSQNQRDGFLSMAGPGSVPQSDEITAKFDGHTTVSALCLYYGDRRLACAMENVIADRVKNARLTKAQQKIAEYFIQKPKRVGMSFSMEAAKAIGVSDASITPFAWA